MAEEHYDPAEEVKSLIKTTLAVLFPTWRRDVYTDVLDEGTIAQVNADPDTKQVTVRVAYNTPHYNLSDEHLQEIALHESAHIIEKMLSSDDSIEKRTHIIAEVIKRYGEYSAARAVLGNPQICKRCGHVSAVEFSALDSEWGEIAGEYADGVLCINCFTELAAIRGNTPTVHIIPMRGQSLLNEDALMLLGEDLSTSPNPHEWLRIVFKKLDSAQLAKVVSVAEEEYDEKQATV